MPDGAQEASAVREVSVERVPGSESESMVVEVEDGADRVRRPARSRGVESEGESRDWGKAIAVGWVAIRARYFSIGNCQWCVKTYVGEVSIIRLSASGTSSTALTIALQSEIRTSPSPMLAVEPEPLTSR